MRPFFVYSRSSSARYRRQTKGLLERLSDGQLEELSVAVLTAGSYAEWREQLQKLSKDTD